MASAAAVSVPALLVLAGLAGCGDPAVLVEVAADGLAVPADLDAVCLAVADRAVTGGSVGQTYRFPADFMTLPQSLAVDPGSAGSAEAWARGSHLGLEVARDRTEFGFGGGKVGLTLAACPGGPSGASKVVDHASLPMGSQIAVSLGRGGSRVVAVGAGKAAVLRAHDGALTVRPAQVAAVRAAAPAALLAFDADGDCDDDLLVLWSDAQPTLWLREGEDFATTVAVAGAPPERAAVAGDLDGDGDVDLVLGGATSLGVWLNDGTGRFAAAPALVGDGTTDVTALGLGDVDGDGDLDLIVGRGQDAAATPAVFFGIGGGVFELAPAALPAVALETRALAVGDLTGDGRVDVALVALAAPIKLYVNRGDGRLEDRSFVALPSQDPIDGTSVALGDWDGDCLPDLVVGQAAAAPIGLRGADGGTLVADGAPAGQGPRVILADIDDDGDRDLVSAAASGLTWGAR